MVNIRGYNLLDYYISFFFFSLTKEVTVHTVLYLAFSVNSVEKLCLSSSLNLSFSDCIKILMRDCIKVYITNS